jgi:hypothetical protein
MEPKRPPTASHRSGDEFATQLRGFGPLGLIAVVVILLSGTAHFHSWAIPVGALLALAWVRLSGSPWRDIGYSKPKSWIAAVVIGVVFGVLLKFLLKAVLLPLLAADPANQAFRFLRGNRGVLPAAIWTMLMAGFGEETVFRGFLFERLNKLIGSSISAKVFTVLFTSACFAGAHYSLQGVVGVQQAAVTGLALGTAFALTGQIWIPMIAHAAFDLTALAIIYWNLEAAVAHLIFK